MYEYHGADLHFVLIDYDMATVLTKKKGERYRPSSKHRTGTLPFMAVELIENAAHCFDEADDYKPIPHLFRHDVESVFWLSVWCPAVLTEPQNAYETKRKEKNMAVVRAWETTDLMQIAKDKSYTRKAPLELSGIRLLGNAKCLDMWYHKWNVIWAKVDQVMTDVKLKDAYAKIRGQPAPKFDYETAGGLLTREAIMAALVLDSDETQSDISDTPSDTTEVPKRRSKRVASRKTLADSAPENPKARKGRKVAAVTRKVSSRKAEKVAGHPVSTKSSRRGRKKPSSPVKEVAVKDTARKTTVKKAATKRRNAKETVTKETVRPTKARRPTTKPEDAAAPGNDESGPEKLNENDIRSRLRPRKRI